MNIKEIVKDSRAKFVYYREGNFTYETSTGFKFIIPLEEANGITLNAEEKSIYFMRWIRKQLENEAHTIT